MPPMGPCHRGIAPSRPPSTRKGKYCPHCHLTAEQVTCPGPHHLVNGIPAPRVISEKSYPENAFPTNFTCRRSWTHGLCLVLTPLEVLEAIFGKLRRTTEREDQVGRCCSKGGIVLPDSTLCGTAGDTSSPRAAVWPGLPSQWVMELDGFPGMARPLQGGLCTFP